MTFVSTGGSKFSQFMANHIFGNEYRHMFTAVMYGNSMS